MGYYTHALGPVKGPWLARDVCGAACQVMEFPDKPMSQIGMALPVGGDNSGVELWRIILNKSGELPGRWVVIDREFVPAE